MSLRNGACVEKGSKIFVLNEEQKIEEVSIEEVITLVEYQIEAHKKSSTTSNCKQLRPVKTLTGFNAYPLLKFAFSIPEKDREPLVKLSFTIEPVAYLHSDQNDNEKYITTSLDHPFYTSRGVLPAMFLRRGDYVRAVKDGTEADFREARITQREIICASETELVGIILGSLEYKETLLRVTQSYFPTGAGENEDIALCEREMEDYVRSSAVHYEDNGFINGLSARSHFIYTNHIASGTLPVQQALLAEMLRGYRLRDLMP